MFYVGVSDTSSLAYMERHFLNAINHNLFVTDEEYAETVKQLENIGQMSFSSSEEEKQHSITFLKVLNE